MKSAKLSGMPLSPKRALELALALENATSYPHFERVAIRTPRRTFATVALHGRDMNFAFDLAQQAHFCSLAPGAITPVEGGWGRMGWTRCDLSQIDVSTFKLALSAAHARSNVPAKATRQGASARPKKVTREGASARPKKVTRQGASARPKKATRQGASARPKKATRQGASARPKKATGDGAPSDVEKTRRSRG